MQERNVFSYIALTIPLIVGVLVLIGIWTTGEKLYFSLGFANIFAAILLTLIALMTIFLSVSKGQSSPRSIAIVLVMIFLNLPLVGLYIHAALDYNGSIRVTLQNSSSTLLEHVQLDCSGKLYQEKDLPPGKKFTFHCKPPQEGNVVLKVAQLQVEKEITYAKPGSGEAYLVRLTPEQEFEILNH